MDELIDDPEPEGLLRPLHLAGEDDVERGARADEPRQPLAATGRGQDAELHLGEPELGLGVIGRHPVMARQGELEAAAQAGPVDADGDRLREARHALQQLLTVRDEALGFGGARERDELLDVGARDEVVRLAREERHGPHRALALERFERREEVGFQRARDFVDRFALHVERDDRDPVGQLPAECGSRHQRRSRTMAKPMPPCAQIDSSPNCTSRRAISLASVVTMRPPVAPNG